jgi:hypothetical protein
MDLQDLEEIGALQLFQKLFGYYLHILFDRTILPQGELGTPKAYYSPTPFLIQTQKLLRSKFSCHFGTHLVLHQRISK